MTQVCQLPIGSVKPSPPHSAPFIQQTFQGKVSPLLPKCVVLVQSNTSKFILQRDFPQSQSTIKMTYLRQFCCGSRQKWTTKLLLRANGCWKWWGRKYSCNTINFVYPPLHFFWTPMRNRYIYISVFLYLKCITPCPFLITNLKWHIKSFIYFSWYN